MAETLHEETLVNPEVRYEATDANVRWILVFAASLVVLSAVVFVFLLWFFRFLLAREPAVAPPPSMLSGQEQGRLPSAPRLEGLVSYDQLYGIPAARGPAASKYGWVDRPRKIVRIPIEEAMRIEAEKASAASPGKTPPPAVGQREPAASQFLELRPNAGRRAAMSACSNRAVCATASQKPCPTSPHSTASAKPWHTIRAAFLLTAVLSLAAPLSAQDAAPAIRRDVGIDQHLDAQVPGDLEFRDESGKAVRLGDYFHDRPHILILVYFSCQKMCPMTLDTIRGRLEAFADLDVGKALDVIVVSFDPRDKPSMAAERKEAMVARYGRPGAEEGWHFLTGEQPAIDRLTGAVGFRYAEGTTPGQFVHPAGVMILTPEGRVSRYLIDTLFPPTDLRLALVEASDGKIGTPTDGVLLYCFHYDATKGKYTTSVMNFVRAGGVLIVAALGVFWFAMWRKGRGNHRRGSHHGDTEDTEKNV